MKQKQHHIVQCYPEAEKEEREDSREDSCEENKEEGLRERVDKEERGDKEDK